MKKWPHSQQAKSRASMNRIGKRISRIRVLRPANKRALLLQSERELVRLAGEIHANIYGVAHSRFVDFNDAACDFIASAACVARLEVVAVAGEHQAVGQNLSA
jgi:hypothetical protein